MIKKNSLIKIGVLVIIIAIFLFIPQLNMGLKNMINSFKSVDSVRNYIQSFGVWAVTISFFMMILQSIIAPIPAFFITFANAIVWGWWKGAILSWSSAMAGAAICFMISRVYGRNIAEKITSKMAIDDIDIFFKKYGKNAILVARLLPFVPFDPISYAAGLTAMSFIDFFISTGIGQLPATIIYSYAAAKSTDPSTFTKGLLILFATTILIYTIKKIWTEKNKVEGFK